MKPRLVAPLAVLTISFLISAIPPASAQPDTPEARTVTEPTNGGWINEFCAGDHFDPQTGEVSCWGATQFVGTWTGHTVAYVQGHVDLSTGNIRWTGPEGDGTGVATDQTDPDGRNIDVWVHELSRGTVTRLTFDPALDQTPVWSADSQKVLFSSNRGGNFALYLKNADGSGSERQLVDYGGALANPWDWSRDGKYVLVRKGSELGYLAWPERTTTALFQAKWTVRGAQFSADGRWIAYSSNETGNMEVYVSPFPSVNGKWQVSNAGGQEPKWRSDGKELFYMSRDGKIMAVSVSTGASFEAGTPVALFQTHRRQPMSSQDLFSYDVSSNGQRFLIATKLDEPSAAPLSVLLNWASEMEK